MSPEDIKKKFLSILPPKTVNPQETIDLLQNILPDVQKFLESKNDIEFQNPENIKDETNYINKDLPLVGIDADEILKILRKEIIPSFQYENVNFFGFIPRSPTHISMLADSLVPFFNQFLGAAMASPKAVLIETLTIKWIGEMLGYSENFFGSYTIGGSHANLECLSTALTNILPWDTQEHGFTYEKSPILYTTNQSHACISKSARFLGIGLKNLRFIETNENFEMDWNALEDQIRLDLESNDKIPSVIIATSGTTNTGAVDNFEELSRIAKKYNLWLHVDGAYGGFVRIADHEVAKQVKNIHLADSIAIDTHKWLYSPLEGGLSLVKDENHLKKAFDFNAEYLEDTKYRNFGLVRNFSEYGFALSRRWRGFMVWINFVFYGKKGLSSLITRNILLADYFRELIKVDDELELFGHSQLGIVCFTHPNKELNTHIFHQVMAHGKRLIGRTTLKGQSVLRISILNEYTEIPHIDDLYQELKSIIANYWLLHPV